MDKKKLEDLSIMEIKALVYDQLASIEQSQQNIKLLNEELRRRPALNGATPHIEAPIEA